MPKIISRSEALENNLKYYYTGKPCKHGHKAEYLTSSHSCSVCRKIYYKKNKDKIQKRARLWDIKNREHSNKLKNQSHHRNKKLKFIPKLIPGKTEFITRQEAIEKGLKTYFNGRPCKLGHITERNVKDKQCPICQKDRFKIWANKNKDKVQEDRKLWLKANPNYKKNYNKRNYEKVKLQWRKDYIKNKEYYSKYNAAYKLRRIKEDPMFKLIQNMRTRIGQYLRKPNVKIIKKNKTRELIGCTQQVLKDHLEKKFKPGMNWKNHSLKGWHVDHIKPLASAKNYEDFKKLCHYSNLQPLWAVENLSKGDKY